MAGLDECPNPTGGLEIGALSLHLPSWSITDSFMPLWFIQNYVGGNDITWGVHGTDPNPLRPTEAVHRMNMLVVGEWAPDGSRWLDPWAGIEFNCNALRTIIDPLVADNSEQAATLHMPSGRVRIADVQVQPFRVGPPVYGREHRTGYLGVMSKCQFSLTIPSGIFVPA